MTSIDRFWQQLDKKEGGCWEWTGGLFENGYGQHWHDGRLWRAHRLAYTLARGPIPEGLCVLHACDNRRCCNPRHLHLGTNADNQHEMDERGRRRGWATKAPLTAEAVTEIQREYNTYWGSVNVLAKRHGVSRKTIRRIGRGH